MNHQYFVVGRDARGWGIISDSPCKPTAEEALAHVWIKLGPLPRNPEMVVTQIDVFHPSDCPCGWTRSAVTAGEPVLTVKPEPEPEPEPETPRGWDVIDTSIEAGAPVCHRCKLHIVMPGRAICQCCERKEWWAPSVEQASVWRTCSGSNAQ